MTHYARGALISDVQPPHSQWDAFGIYGDHSAYWLSREPCFTPTQLEELDLEYIPEHSLPFCLSHSAVLRIRRGGPDQPAGRNAPQPRRSVRHPTRARAQLPARTHSGLTRAGNY